MRSASVLASNVAVVSHRIAIQSLVAGMSACGVHVAFVVFLRHVHWLWVCQHCLYLALFHLQGVQKVFGRVWTTIELWWLGLSVSSDHHVAVAAGFMTGCLLGDVFGGV